MGLSVAFFWFMLSTRVPQLPPPEYVLAERLYRGPMNGTLAPFPLYFTPLGEPATEEVRVEDKDYDVIWDGKKLEVQHHPSRKIYSWMTATMVVSACWFWPHFLSWVFVHVKALGWWK